MEGGASTSPIVESAPTGDLKGWFGEASNSSVSNKVLHVYALCGPSGLTLANR